MKKAERADGPKRQRRLRAAVRRELILDVALKMFAQHGYRVGMDELAEASGVTRTVLYYYAPSKLDLFQAVAEAQLTVLLKYVAPAMASDGTVYERLRATLDAALRFADEEPLAWQILFVRLNTDEPDLAPVRDRVHDNVISAVAGLVRSELEAVGVDPNTVPGRIAAEIFAGAISTVPKWWATHPSASREAVLDAMTDMLWHGLGGMGLVHRNRTQPRKTRAQRQGA